MSKQGFRLKAILLTLVFELLTVSLASAGSAIIGSVAGSTETTLDGVALRPNTTLFSGESLQVNSGLAVVAVGKTTRMVFGRDTVASFIREANEVTILLGQGNVSLFHPDDSVAVRVKAGDISVTPQTGFKSLGEIAMLDGYLVITSKEGALLVDDGNQTQRVVKGQPLTIDSRPARTPQGSGTIASKLRPHLSWHRGMQVATVGSSASSAIVSAVTMSRSRDTVTMANTATADDLLAQEADQAAALANSAAAGLLSQACNGINNIVQSLSPSLPYPVPPSSCGSGAVPAAVSVHSTN